MSQQSDMADAVYSWLLEAPVPAANIVHELRTKWGPAHKVGGVHRFVEEVAACLLHHDDIEVGDISDGHFTAWPLEPWDAHFKLQQELLAMDSFLDDPSRYVFRRTQKT